MNTFEMNGKTYTTDTETVELLRGLVATKQTAGIIAVMELGLKVGRIREVK